MLHGYFLESLTKGEAHITLSTPGGVSVYPRDYTRRQLDLICQAVRIDRNTVSHGTGFFDWMTNRFIIEIALGFNLPSLSKPFSYLAHPFRIYQICLHVQSNLNITMVFYAAKHSLCNGSWAVRTFKWPGNPNAAKDLCLNFARCQFSL